MLPARTWRAAQADDLLQRVIGFPSHRQQLVARPQDGKKGCRYGVRAGHKLRADKCCLCAHNFRHHLTHKRCMSDTQAFSGLRLLVCSAVVCSAGMIKARQALDSNLYFCTELFQKSLTHLVKSRSAKVAVAVSCRAGKVVRPDACFAHSHLQPLQVCSNQLVVHIGKHVFQLLCFQPYLQWKGADK